MTSDELGNSGQSPSLALRRDIYIHGTPEERNIGRPASYGCIRMRSADIINLYSQEPAHTQLVAEEIARAREVSLEEITGATTATAQEFFRFERK